MTAQWDLVQKRRRQIRHARVVAKAEKTWIRKRGRLPRQRYLDIKHLRWELNAQSLPKALIEAVYHPL
jgi:hypothetical protein